MSMLFRCDVCQVEVKTFWNIAIVRKRITPDGVTDTKNKAFDVCSEKCEAEGLSMILSAVLPHIDITTPIEKSQA